MKKINKQMTEYIQGDYKAYCMYVHTPEFFTVKGYPEEDLKWKPTKFHMFLCDAVQEFVEKPTDKAYEILVISTPPQHGKSKTITETLPSWFIMKNPDKSVIEISYGNNLAERFGKANLDKVKKYGRHFGIEVDPRKCTSQEFDIKDHEGKMISQGVGASLTGYSGHLIVIDDPVKNREDADSELQREHLWQEFFDSILSRHQRGTKVVLIMTRWHEDDLAGRIIDRFPEDVVTVINLPCEAEDDDPLGRKPGEPLCPEIKKDKAWLDSFKQTIQDEHGMRTWNALYQGHPVAIEGNLLKREWWDFYDEDPRDLVFDRVIMSVDAAFKDGKRNDYVAISVWGKKRNKIYLLDLINEHLNFKATVNKIRQMKVDWPEVGSILIEDKANGTAAIELLRDNVMGIKGVSADVSKEARVNAISFLIEAKNVLLPRKALFTFDLIDQCAAFPNGKHDDMVDSMSQALNELRKTRFSERVKNKVRYQGAQIDKGEQIYVI